MNTALMPFTFNDALVRALLDDQGNSWFVAKDVCQVLEIVNHNDAISSLDEDEKGVANTDPLSIGGSQQVRTVSESGLYSLIFRSRKDEAKRFRKWVTAEVLPAIRKTGGYARPGFKVVEEAQVSESVTAAVRDLEAVDSRFPFSSPTMCVKERAVRLAEAFGFADESFANEAALCCLKLLRTKEPLDSVAEDPELTPQKLALIWDATKEYEEESTPRHAHLRAFLLFAKFMEKRLDATRVERLERKALQGIAEYLCVSRPFAGSKSFEVTITPK